MLTALNQPRFESRLKSLQERVSFNLRQQHRPPHASEVSRMLRIGKQRIDPSCPLVWGLVVEECRTSAVVGMRPIKSRLTRRKSSASSANAAGLTCSASRVRAICRSIFLEAAGVSETAGLLGTATMQIASNHLCISASFLSARLGLGRQNAS